MRFRFGPGPLFRASQVRSVMLAVVLLVAGAVVFELASPGVGIALAALGVVWAAITAYGVTHWMRRVDVEFAPDRLVVHGGHASCDLAWEQVGGWGIGEALGSRVTRSSSPSLIVWPVDGVGPDEVGGRWMWLPKAHCFRICRLQYMDGSVEEFSAAFEAQSPGRQRAIG